MDDSPQPVEPALLKFLKVLVTILTVTMIAGVVTIVVLIVIRYRQTPPDFPTVLTLPPGTTPEAYTQTKSWYAIVTEDDRVLIYSRATNKLVREITLEQQ
ncbi:hypothetical protein E7681_11320 [Thalassobius vesicularis]|uniref:Uncharacterized protein n=1 Tax=Thalassobius vesicularis TaxID=1294297 RepID=A0A4S3M831_9RHOB|nr:hypothetical protein E7681_11320 [Thalassobius vesicularis]